MSFLFVCSISVFFFFKQKTAYEMRISDWSSDVCSSDLLASLDFNGPGGAEVQTAQLVIPTAAPLRNAAPVPAETRPAAIVMAANAPVAVAPEAVARARTEDAGPTRIAKLAAPQDRKSPV